jgi:AAA+ ATPase superfamily predicted ATPase
MKMMQEKFRKARLPFNEKQLKEMYAITDGYPYYLQWMGDKIYDSGKKEITEGLIQDSLKAMLKEGDAVFRSSLENISAGERSVIIEIGLGNKHISKIANRIDKPLPNIAKMVERLIEKWYVIKKGTGEYEIIDPMLKKWIKLTYGT